MAETKKFAKGTVIFREGAWEMLMYEVLSGKVGIYAGYGTDQEEKLTDVTEGKFFGEMGLIEARFRSATAVALEDTETAVIDGSSFKDYFEKDPARMMAVLTNLTNRVRALSEEYIDTCDAITQYVEADSAKKKTLWQRIAALCDLGSNTEAEEMYSQLAQHDPTFSMNYEGWY